jgi:predicted DNA-binding transcriptional regulator YafY
MLTEQDAMNLIRRALAMHDAERPVPTAVTVADAARMLEVSTRTMSRMRPPKNKAGLVPYSWVIEQLAAK